MLLCSSHREVIELRSGLQRTPLHPPSEGRSFRPGCVRSVRRLWLHRGQTNVVAWQGNWEALSCVGRILWDSGPLVPQLPLRVFGPLRTVSALCWKWLASTSSGVCTARQTEKCAYCFRPWADCSLIISGPLISILEVIPWLVIRKHHLPSPNLLLCLSLLNI